MAEQVRICLACGHENLSDSQFCGRCGAALLPPAPGQKAETGEALQAGAADGIAPTSTDIQAPAGVEYAGFRLRSIAFMIDGAIVFGAVAILKVIIFFIESFSFRYFYLDSLPGIILWGWIILWESPLLWLIAPAYFWVLSGTRGQTLGKVALRVQVVRRSGEGPGLGRAALRELLAKPLLYLLTVGPPLLLAGFVLSSLVLEGDLEGVPAALWLLPAGASVGLVGVLWMIWDPQRQGWHDKLAGTYVVKMPRPVRR